MLAATFAVAGVRDPIIQLRLPSRIPQHIVTLHPPAQMQSQTTSAHLEKQLSAVLFVTRVTLVPVVAPKLACHCSVRQPPHCRGQGRHAAGGARAVQLLYSTCRQHAAHPKHQHVEQSSLQLSAQHKLNSTQKGLRLLGWLSTVGQCYYSPRAEQPSQQLSKQVE
jgi:hypothetical protein